MIKKTVTYTDFNDKVKTEDCWFHLSKADLVKLEIGAVSKTTDSFQSKLQAIIDSSNGPEMIVAVDNILKTAYGRRSEDGSRFEKTDAIWDDFRSSAVYSELFYMLFSKEDEAATFINSLIPKDLQEQAQQVAKTYELPEGALETKAPAITMPSPTNEGPGRNGLGQRIFTPDQLKNMTPDELSAFQQQMQAGTAVLES